MNWDLLKHLLSPSFLVNSAKSMRKVLLKENLAPSVSDYHAISSGVRREKFASEAGNAHFSENERLRLYGLLFHNRHGVKWVGAGLAAALMIVIVMVAYLRHTPVFVNSDDPIYVTRNVVLDRGFCTEGVEWAFGSVVACNWHPMTSLSLLVINGVAGKSAPGMRAVNVVLHVLNGILVAFGFALATRSRVAALLLGGLFLFHPIHVCNGSA